MGFGPNDAIPFPMEKQEVAKPHLMAKVRVLGSPSGSGSESTVAVIDIVKEACCHLVAPNNSRLFLALTFSLLCPLSTLILLSHALIPRLLASVPQTDLISARLAETLLFQALSLPALAIFWLPAKAAVLCILSFHTKPALSELALAWRNMALTGAYATLAALGLSTGAATLLLVLESLEWAPGLALLAAKLALGTVYAVLFAHLLVISSLAGAVCVAEKCSGVSAFRRAILLMKDKTQLALLLCILPSLAYALVETVFRNQVLALAPPPPTISPTWWYTAITLPTWWFPLATTATLPTWLWEGSLLVLAYSFIYLFDATASGAFYHSCIKSSCTLDQCEASCSRVKRILFELDIV